MTGPENRAEVAVFNLANEERLECILDAEGKLAVCDGLSF